MYSKLCSRCKNKSWLQYCKPFLPSLHHKQCFAAGTVNQNIAKDRFLIFFFEKG